VAGDDCGLVGQRGQKADHVADHFGLREGGKLDRVRRAAETPHVGRDNVIAGLAQGSQLVHRVPLPQCAGEFRWPPPNGKQCRPQASSVG